MEKIDSEKLETFGHAHSAEIASGERFEFGNNWRRFLSVLDDDRITSAERSLAEMLGHRSLEGKKFLDIGSGSGLFSLAARRLGANVLSFDYDPASVACTKELRRRYFPNNSHWTIEQGSVLDVDYVSSLGKFDIVYSWGVLHHTGDMWNALANAAIPVAESGQLFIAIYNDLGTRSRRWHWIKKTYCRLPGFLKLPYALLMSIPEEARSFAGSLLRASPSDYVARWTKYHSHRGMNRWYDIVDWVGGYPYEYAGPSALFDFFSERGFRLERLRCDNVGLGCNEMVFRRAKDEDQPID